MHNVIKYYERERELCFFSLFSSNFDGNYSFKQKVLYVQYRMKEDENINNYALDIFLAKLKIRKTKYY